MIGLLFLFGAGIWLILAVVISVNMPRWLGVTKHYTRVVLLSFPLVLVAPFTDEVIGRFQFYRLCANEAVVTISPTWSEVKRAKMYSRTRTEVDHSIMPIYSSGSEFVDIDTGKIFFRATNFSTNGGLLIGRLGLGLGNSSQCLPKDLNNFYRSINIDRLLEHGKDK